MKINAKEFDKVARGPFSPVYPVIAEQIVSYTNIRQGVCLDIGCGSGRLGAEVAKISDLFIRFFDASEDMIEIVKNTIAEYHIENRAETLKGDVADIPLPDESVNLAVSRGSVFFWEDLPGAFKEIYRILAPQGVAYIGGGFGSKTIRDRIIEKMEVRNDNSGQFRNKVRKNLGPETREQLAAALKTAGIDTFTVLQNEEVGLWVVITKDT